MFSWKRHWFQQTMWSIDVSEYVLDVGLSMKRLDDWRTIPVVSVRPARSQHFQDGLVQIKLEIPIVHRCSFADNSDRTGGYGLHASPPTHSSCLRGNGYDMPGF